MNGKESKVSEWAEQLRERDRIREEGGTTGIDDAVAMRRHNAAWKAQERQAATKAKAAS